MSRTLVVWCPDWPVVAAGIIEGIPAHQPVAVLAANRVVACCGLARAEGVRRGLRKREAQGRCPRLTVLDHDPDRDARAFEPVLTAVEELAPGVEVLRPGACALAARGPASYFGGEERAAERIVEQVAQSCGVEAQVGVADGVFAAGLAARAGQLVPPGQTPGFLADLDISTVDRPDLVGLLRRLGIQTLGEFAALPAADVLARFGFDAALAHRQAAGQDERPLAVRQPPPDLAVTESFDEPLERVDVAAFAARQLAGRLHERLAGHGLACTRLGIGAVTGHGEELHRTWRHDGLLSAAAIADRLRWQLDGWLTAMRRSGAPRAGGPDGGIVRLVLVPEGVIEHGGLQLGLWGDAGQGRERAHRALTRVQAMLGPEAVLTAVLGGGRGPGDEVRLVPWGDERLPTRPGETSAVADGATGSGSAAGPDGGSGSGGSVRPPWPGRLPAPSPASVLPEPVAVRVLDAGGAPVTVSARLVMSGEPAALLRDREPAAEITGWAGPWPVDERWWAPGEASRQARFQVCLADGRALLLSLRTGAWFVAAVYD
jgi:protein ImuB